MSYIEEEAKKRKVSRAVLVGALTRVNRFEPKKREKRGKYSFKGTGWVSITVRMPETVDKEIDDLVKYLREKEDVPATRYEVYLLCILIGLQVLKKEKRFYELIKDFPLYRDIKETGPDLPFGDYDTVWESFYRIETMFRDSDTLDKWLGFFKRLEKEKKDSSVRFR